MVLKTFASCLLLTQRKLFTIFLVQHLRHPMHTLVRGGHASNPSIREVDTGDLPSLRLAWAS